MAVCLMLSGKSRALGLPPSRKFLPVAETAVVLFAVEPLVLLLSFVAAMPAL